MYNKISPIILNLAKSHGSGSVHISQPNAESEMLAGKLFILADLDLKKNDGDKFLDFLISELEENYYNNEKLLLIGKVDGLKAENIFEAALSKTNKAISEFLKDHKLQLNPNKTNISLGVASGNKLHFASYGKNKAVLIYRRSDGYEIINVDNQAKTAPINSSSSNEKKPTKVNNLFSSIISGEIPLSSYFLFLSEATREYLSNEELVKVVTKLPPIVAAEQIKNNLAKINSFVPFLGIIIKNTTDSLGQEVKESSREPLSAHHSISNLNDTEEKTENMLSPAGLISLSRAGRNLRNLLKTNPNPKENNKKDTENQNTEAGKPAYIGPKLKDRGKSLNLPSASSFLKTPKVRLKKTSRSFAKNLARAIKSLPLLFSADFWKGLSKSINLWFRGLSRKHMALFVAMIIILAALLSSILYLSHQRNIKQAEEAFNLAVTEIEEKEALIQSYLLYENREGAGKVLENIEELANELPQTEDYQINTYSEIRDRISNWKDTILGIERIDEANQGAEYTDLNLHSLVVAGDNAYATSNDEIYQLNLADASSENLSVESSQNKLGVYDEINETAYFLDSEKAILINNNNQNINTYKLSDYNGEDSFAVYNSRIYLLNSSDKQIYRYSTNGSSRTNWLNSGVDITGASDLYIDGSIYLLYSNGGIKKYHTGSEESYNFEAPESEIDSATRLIGDANKLYYLSNQNRVTVINKSDGKLLGQYIFNKLQIDDIAISSDTKTIYLLANSSIYSFKLP
jgi:hypothetical protein